MVHLPSGELRLDGGLAIDEVNELLDIELPSEDWDTVGGFVFGTLGHVRTRGSRRVRRPPLHGVEDGRPADQRGRGVGRRRRVRSRHELTDREHGASPTRA